MKPKCSDRINLNQIILTNNSNNNNNNLWPAKVVKVDFWCEVKKKVQKRDKIVNKIAILLLFHRKNFSSKTQFRVLKISFNNIL